MDALQGSMTTLDEGEGAAILPWYLPTGITTANCIAAYAPKGAASLADSYNNLASPGTYTAAFVISTGWDATNGWIGNGSRYLTTGIVPVVGGSIFVRFTNGDINILYGSLVAGNDGKDYFIDSMSVGTRFANGGRLSSTAFTAGVLGVAGTKAYKNGVAVTGGMSSANITTIPLVMLARNINNGTPDSKSISRIQAFVAYNVALSDAQALELSNSMAAL